MFLRFNTLDKDRKPQRYWSVVAKRGLRSGQTTQRRFLYLGQINEAEQAAWRKSLEAIDQTTEQAEEICLFPEGRAIPADVLKGLQVKLCGLTVRGFRVFGDCWPGCRLWDELRLGDFWREHLADGKADVSSFKVLEPLTIGQLVAPGSKRHLHRRRFLNSAMEALLDEDFAVAVNNRLWECLDRLEPHRTAVLTHLHDRWNLESGIRPLGFGR